MSDHFKTRLTQAQSVSQLRDTYQGIWRENPRLSQITRQSIANLFYQQLQALRLA